MAILRVGQAKNQSVIMCPTDGDKWMAKGGERDMEQRIERGEPSIHLYEYTYLFQETLFNSFPLEFTVPTHEYFSQRREKSN